MDFSLLPFFTTWPRAGAGAACEQGFRSRAGAGAACEQGFRSRLGMSHFHICRCSMVLLCWRIFALLFFLELHTFLWYCPSKALDGCCNLYMQVQCLLINSMAFNSYSPHHILINGDSTLSRFCLSLLMLLEIFMSQHH